MSEYECVEFLPHDGEAGRCSRCGSPLGGRQRRWCSTRCQNEWREQHDWGSARIAARRRDNQECVREGCGARVGLEVNHIDPRNGRGYGWGCWNHLTNLETLCHPHHLEVTAQQAAERSALGQRLHRERFPESYPDLYADQGVLDFGGVA